MAASSPPERALVLVLLALTAVTGVVDAVSYLALGHVFTANMTGNVVFLAFALAGAPGVSVPRCSTALGGFFVGALLGGGLIARMSAGPGHRWAATAFAAEAALLLAAGAAAMRYPAPPLDNSTHLYAVIILTALSMGLRSATVRSLGVPDLTTTVLTLTIAGLGADLAVAGRSNPRWPRRTASVLAMAAGAAGGVLLLRHSLALPLAGCAVVACACALSFYLWGGGRPAATANRLPPAAQFGSTP